MQSGAFRSLRGNHTCQCSRLKRRSYGASYGNQHAINMQSHLPMLEAEEEIVRSFNGNQHAINMQSHLPMLEAEEKIVRSFIRHRQRVAWQAAIDELPPVALT